MLRADVAGGVSVAAQLGRLGFKPVPFGRFCDHDVPVAGAAAAMYADLTFPRYRANACTRRRVCAEATSGRRLRPARREPWTKPMDSHDIELPDLDEVADLVANWRATQGEFAVLLAAGDPFQALRQFGTFCRNHGRTDLATQALYAALALAPGTTGIWRELASIHQIVGDDALAMSCAAQSLVIDPGHAITWLQFASLAYKLQHIDQSEAAYLRALSLEPNLGDAQLGLGVLYLGTRKFDDAIVHLRHALVWGGADGVTQLCLGQALYMAGRFGASADAFAQSAQFAPLGGITLRLYARSRTFATMLDGDIDAALSGYPALAGAEAETIDEILRAAFSLFSAYGMQDAAVAIGRLRLARQPDDPVQRYLLDAVAGTSHERAPPAYVEAHFDEFADGFDSKLVDVLGYRVPEKLTDLVASCRPDFAAILDLGCGTGLAAEPLARLKGKLTGVDLSEKMLAVARRRGSYHSLIKDDVVGFLDGQQNAFDLIFAADLLIYLGRLDGLIEAAARALTVDGIFAASIERSDADDVVLLPSGRFAHRDTYFEAAVARQFEVVARRATELRIEAGYPVAGLLYVMRRRHQAFGL
jgi:predicted TPR repeat methyltransferase